MFSLLFRFQSSFCFTLKGPLTQDRTQCFPNAGPLKDSSHGLESVNVFRGFQVSGCVSGVASLSSFQTFIVLSPSQVNNLVPVTSNAEAKILASLSSDPG